MSAAAVPSRACMHSRHAFLALLERALWRPKDEPARPLALIVARVDAFRLFNDCHGYSSGDRLLEAIAGRLREAGSGVALAPVAGIEVHLGHLQADEFALLLVGIGEAEVAGIVAEVLARLDGGYEIDGQTTLASFSVGCACTLSGEGGASQLLTEARAAMRRARALGGGRYEIFSAQARARLALRAHIGRDLHRAASGGQLDLVYQPIYDLQSGAVEGVEALLRWNHPQLGSIPPAEFIPIAAESGQIGELGDWVLEQACRGFQSLRRLAPLSRLRFVAINVSRRNLGDQGLPRKVLRALEQGGMQPSALHLEITESELAANLESAAASVRALRELGVGLAIDDFGVGYSSLASLHEFPVDVLKLDRAFIASDIGTHKGRGLTAVAHATINLARNIGLRVVAEGVEKSSQLALLHSLRCDMAQGWLLGRPSTLAQLAYLRSPDIR